MKQADLGLNLTTKRTRKREFLDEMNRVVPRAALVELVAAHVPEGKKGRPPFPVVTMLRIHLVIKRQFGFTKVRYRGLKKNGAQVQTLFAPSNLWMARRKLMAVAA